MEDYLYMNNFKTIIVNLFKNSDIRLFKTYKKPSLGRWGLTGDLGENKCNIKEERIIKQANMDNCGDELCGRPTDYSNGK